MEELDTYMENIDEYVNDENKIVTYKWFSITHKIPCNVSKRLLYHFTTKHSKNDLHVTYFVSGIVKEKDDVLNKVYIVAENDLEAIKESFDKILCIHVYSISKSKLTDQGSILNTTDYDCVRNNLHDATQFGGISCSSAKIHSDADTAALREQAIYRPSTPQDTRKAPDPRLIKPQQNNDKKPVETKTSNSKPKGSLASMFANGQKGIKKENKEEKSVKEEYKQNTKNNNSSKTATKHTGKDNKGAAGKKNISGFFMKGVNQRDVEVKQEVENDSKDEEDDEAKSSSIRRSPRKKAPKQEHPIKKEKKSPVKAPVKKPMVKQAKRSRIMQLDSDSSENEEEDDKNMSEDNEDPAPSPPPEGIEEEDEEVIPFTPLQTKDNNTSSQRGKKRKQVDRTYEDDDGFFVTKKEYVDVTDSESEDPVPLSPPAKRQDSRNKSPIKTQQKQSKAKPKPSPTKTKQASIMNFFKKK